MRKIGLHLHIDDSLVGLSHKALDLQLTFFQCFLSRKDAGRVLSFVSSDIDAFVALRRKHFGDLFLHSSYWVNLCAINRTDHPLLEREIALAKKLEFTHIVLHSGSARGAGGKHKSIDALARALNKLLAGNHGLTVVLENTAHGGMAVGSDLRDFKLLIKKIDQPEKLKFCIDVGHAYLFGYDIVNKQGREDFINRVDTIIGWNNVVLIHLNDTQEACGSKIDQHYSVGSGSIGDEALKAFIMHPKIAQIPVLMEVPMLDKEDQKKLLEKVAGWHQNIEGK